MIHSSYHVCLSSEARPPRTRAWKIGGCKSTVPDPHRCEVMKPLVTPKLKTGTPVTAQTPPRPKPRDPKPTPNSKRQTPRPETSAKSEAIHPKQGFRVQGLGPPVLPFEVCPSSGTLCRVHGTQTSVPC